MLNLFERSEQLEKDVAEIRTLRAVADRAEAIGTRASQFENALAELRLSVGKARLLQDRGVNVELVVQSQGVRHFLRELQSKVADDPATILAARDIQPKMLRPIENDTSAIQESADKAWREYVRQQMPEVGNEFLEALSRIPGLRSKVEHFRGLKDQALRRGERAPASDEDFDLIRELSRQCRQAWQELDAEDMPQEALVLFREAATAQGASLSSLTPAVLAWLTAHGLADALGIRVR